MYKKKQPIINVSVVYKAKNTRLVNGIFNIFPIIRDDMVIGTIGFVQDYEYLDGLINPTCDTQSPIVSDTRFRFSSIIGSDSALLDSINKARMASYSPSPVMLYGETGTGKELFAQAIHNHSHRKESSYIAINCAAIPENLLEGILFGTTKGAFTGAIDKQGLLVQANGGTIFLDEINSMPKSLQAKLLRVIQEMKVRRIGAVKEMNLDLKIISSVNTNPQEAIANGNLRNDLFFRLGVVYITIPALRERPEDIDDLALHFVKKHNRTMKKRVLGVSKEVKAFFHGYQWPGNVRELENAIEGAMNMVWNDVIIDVNHLSSLFNAFDCKPALSENSIFPILKKGTGVPEIRSFPENSKPTAITKKKHDQDSIIKALMASLGNVSEAALKMGISRQALHGKIKKYNIDRQKICYVSEKQKIEESMQDA